MILFAICSLVACKPEPIEIEIRQDAPKLVVYSQYLGGGLCVVSVTKSFATRISGSVLDSAGAKVATSVFVNNAAVILKGNGREIKFESMGNGVYVNENVELLDYNAYEIEVSAAGYDQLKGATQKMRMVAFDSVSANRKYGTDAGISVYYSFTDNSNEENYYVVNYFTKKDREHLPEKPDAEYIASRLLQQNVSFDLFTDRDFLNKRIAVNRNIGNTSLGDTVLVSLSNISKGYYHFLETQKRAGTLFNQLNAEVIHFPTNLVNGYGYFNLVEPDLRIIALE